MRVKLEMSHARERGDESFRTISPGLSDACNPKSQHINALALATGSALSSFGLFAFDIALRLFNERQIVRREYWQCFFK
jgi:hypothetical protein